MICFSFAIILLSIFVKTCLQAKIIPDLQKVCLQTPGVQCFKDLKLFMLMTEQCYSSECVFISMHLL